MATVKALDRKPCGILNTSYEMWEWLSPWKDWRGRRDSNRAFPQGSSANVRSGAKIRNREPRTDLVMPEPLPPCPH